MPTLTGEEKVIALIALYGLVALLVLPRLSSSGSNPYGPGPSPLPPAAPVGGGGVHP